MTPFSQHSPVFNYSLISSHHVERGFESMWRQEGGSLFTLVVLCLFVVEQGWFKGVCFWRQKRQWDRLGPTPPCLFMSLRLHANTHTDTYRTNTSSHSSILFSLRRQIVESLPPLLRDPL